MHSPILAATFLLGFLFLAPSAAQAQQASAPQAAVLSPDQLDWFAGMVNEDPGIVAQRLLWDPALVPLAEAAMDAAAKRRRVGVVLTVAGFSTAVIGLVMGGIIWASGVRLVSDCPYEGGSNCESSGNDQGTMHEGKMIMLVSIIAGLSLGIPGVVTLGSVSQAESDVLQRYRTGVRWRPAVFPPSRSLPGGPPGKSVGLQLLSVAF
jgi:hypothetical protein